MGIFGSRNSFPGLFLLSMSGPDHSGGHGEVVKGGHSSSTAIMGMLYVYN